jgi:hypothetical protein
MSVCEKCGGAAICDSLVSWCPKCTSKEEILRLSLWALTECVAGIIRDSEGFKLKPEIEAGMLAGKGQMVAWEDARESCWLGTLSTAYEALKACGNPDGYGENIGA